MENSEGEMPVDSLVSLAKLVLENNYFEFEDTVFRQKLGTATSLLRGLPIFLWGHWRSDFWIHVK